MRKTFISLIAIILVAGVFVIIGKEQKALNSQKSDTSKEQIYIL